MDNSLSLYFLDKIVNRDRYPYPRIAMRMFPFVERSDVKNVDELLQFGYLEKDVFVSLFSNYQKAEREYDMMFLDVDAKDDLPLAYAKLQLVIEILENAKINNYYIIWSGSKGFHIYVPFEPTRLFNYREACSGWLKSVGLADYLDMQNVEPNRSMRVPCSINTKSGMRVIPLGNYIPNNFDEIMRRVKDCKPVDFDIIPNVGLGFALKNFDSEFESIDKNHVVKGAETVMFSNTKDYPPCFRRLVKMATDNPAVDLNHEERVQMGLWLLHVYGGDVDKVAEYYAGMSDYNESTTKYHIGYLAERGLNVMRCDKLTDAGICCLDHSKCPFFPSIGRFMKRDQDLANQ